jgi:hypothetical protein
MLQKMLLLAQNAVDLEIPDQFFENDAVVFQQNADVAVGAMFFLFFAIWLIVWIVITVLLLILPLWLICKKAGVFPYISLLTLVPGVNLAIYWILALINWPNLKSEAERNADHFANQNQFPENPSLNEEPPNKFGG